MQDQGWKIPSWMIFVIFIGAIYSIFVAINGIKTEKEHFNTEIQTSQMMGTVLDKKYIDYHERRYETYYPAFLIELDNGEKITAIVGKKDGIFRDVNAIRGFANNAKVGDRYIVDVVSKVLYGEEIQRDYYIYLEYQDAEKLKEYKEEP